jgi:hypothetical protein
MTGTMTMAGALGVSIGNQLGASITDEEDRKKEDEDDPKREEEGMELKKMASAHGSKDKTNKKVHPC